MLDLEGNIVLAVGWQDICTKFHRVHPVTAKHCKESDTELTINVPEGTFKLYRCKNNMWDMVTPLFINDLHVGNVYIGQFIFEDEVPDIEVYKKQAREFGFDEKEYLAALRKVPIFSNEKAETGIAFYAKIAKIISTLSYGSIKLSRTIAERERAEEKIRSLLAEKETVLKEVHHRIKNNLNSMNTILLMQSDTVEAPEAKNVLIDASSRLESMRILYDKLYLSGNYQKLNIEDYIGDLIIEIKNIFKNTCDLIIDAAIKSVLISTRIASNIGIIVHELITNSIKHAFIGRGEGAIQININTSGHKIFLKYHDNGHGLPDNFSFETKKGFGMTLIKILVDEMSGSIEIERNAGTTISLTFECQ